MASIKVERFPVNVIATRLNLTSLDFARNFQSATLVLENARRLAENRANSSNVDALTILAFPGLVFTGSECGDAFLRPAVLKAAMDSLLRFENAVPDGFVITLGVPLAYRGKLYKASAFICDGKLRGFSCATVDDLGQRVDLRQFTPWKRGEVAYIEIGNRKLPVGDLGFEEREGLLFEFGSIDRLIAEAGQNVDPFYNPNALDEVALYGLSEVAGIQKPNDAEPSARRVVSRGKLLEESQTPDKPANFIICRNAFPFALGRQRKVREALANLSERYGNCIVYPVPEGVESGSAIYDGGATIACRGYVLQSRRFLYEVEPSCDAFASLTMNVSEKDAILFDDLMEEDRFFRPSDLRKDDLSSGKKLVSWETAGDVLYEEFARVVPYGLFDYMRKCRANGFALSMSGGADSATIAALVRLGVKFASERGIHTFLRWLSSDSHDWNTLIGRFPQLGRLQRDSELWRRVFSEEGEERAISEEESNMCQLDIVSFLLTTFYQATRNSSETTRVAAREVANECGATHYEFDVDSIIEQYKSMVAEAMNDPWRWDRDDVALQNIQARGRGPSAWLVANKTGRLLLATGNRSEVACGYATMDGDTCGGLSPIAGVDKAFIRKWLVWLERTGVLLEKGDNDKLSPRRFCIPALRYINEQQPTAELRPLETKQTDEADLMPYPILNAFERALIRDRLPFGDALARVASEARDLGVTVDAETLLEWGRRFGRLWSVSQWKRQRYAPGFQLDDYDLAPTSWTVYPIVSAGFSFEFDQ